MDQKEYDAELEKWLEGRPQIIKDLARKYPPNGNYIMKQGAPYGISCAGTKVHFYAYRENGNIKMIVLAKDKLPSAIEHEKELCRKHNRSAQETETILKANVVVEVDPRWVQNLNAPDSFIPN